MTRTLNFNAGPAALPLPALERAREELLDFAGSGMSVMEHSHRGKEYEAVHHEASALMRELLGVPEDYDVLFLQGGASMQFAQVPMNFLSRGRRADYVVTGVWGEKAVAEAKIVAAQYGEKAHEVVTTRTGEGKDATYVRTPTQAELAHIEPTATYAHFTSNETIHGVQYATAPGEDFPSFGPSPLVCDMSSDFMWRKVDVNRFAFIYAGAQKNIGPSGVTVVIASHAFLEEGRKDIPKIFQYRTHAENDSLYNTPPTFGDLPDSQRPLLGEVDRRARRHREPQPRKGTPPLRSHRRPRRLLPMSRREAVALPHERRLPPPERGARGQVRLRGEEAAHGRPQGAPQRRGDPRLDVQRRQRRVGEHPGGLHARLRQEERVRGSQ